MVRTGLLLLALILAVAGGLAQEYEAQPATSTSPHYVRSFSSHVEAAQPAYTVQAPWQRLERVPVEDRLNSTLSVELIPGAPYRAQVLAREVEKLWSSRDFEGALANAHELSAIVEPSDVELAFQWTRPRISTAQNLVGTNVRIGDIDSATTVSLAANADGSRLYCAISQRGDGHVGSWHLFLSTDKGATWSNTYTQEGTAVAPKTVLCPTGSRMYLGYLPYANLKYLRVKRFNMSSGLSEDMANGASYYDVLTAAGGEQFTDIAGASNLCAYGNRMYLAVSTNQHALHYFWGMTSPDTMWTEIPDSDAVAVGSGLSTAWGFKQQDTTYYWYVSYADTNGQVCIDTTTHGSQFKRAFSFNGANGLTSLSAYGDTAICAFDYYGGGTDHFLYLINYTGGRSQWRYGFPEDTTQTTETPAAMIEKGQGMGIFYRYYTPTGREGRFVYRDYAFGSTWTAPVPITDYSPHYLRYGIVALGDKTWGMVYIVSNYVPALGSVIFVSYKVIPTSVGDDARTTPVAHELHRNYPNPFNPTTNIGYTVGADSRVRLEVYDLLGREVAVLLDERKAAGTYHIGFDGAKLASGIYICRMTAGDFTSSMKMILMR